MPQMAPALWVLILVFITSINIWVKSTIYFYLPLPKSLSETLTLKYNLNTWIW